MNRRRRSKKNIPIIRSLIVASSVFFIGRAALSSGTSEDAGRLQLHEQHFSAKKYAPQIGPKPALWPAGNGKIRSGDSLGRALARVHVSSVEVDQIVRALEGLYDFRNARPGHRFEVMTDAAGRLGWFRYTASRTEVFQVFRDVDGQMRALKEPVNVRTVREVVEGVVNGSLYLAMERAGQDPGLAIHFAELFAWDIDFFTETQNGDRFGVIVERDYASGSPIGYGKILAAEYEKVNGEKQRAFFYEHTDGTQGYYTQSGQSVKKAFLKSPIKFATITSGFGMRKHPILKYRRAHRGVDYAAPRGTSIWALGDGVVTFAGRKGGYGNVLIIRHRNGLETRYAHVSRFAKGVRTHKRVSQKQVVAYVGSSGLATGPHLHFEVLKNGKHANPLKVVRPPAPPVPAKEKSRFEATIEPFIASLDAEQPLALLK